jgi:hypothetical protein
MRRILVCSLVALVYTSCGGEAVPGDDLDRETVSSIPPGDALGTAATGDYDTELRVKTCSGLCPDLVIGAESYPICAEGQQYAEILEVSQEDGYLEVYLDLGFIETVMAGGIYRNRNFEVGGFTASSYGDVDVSALTKGVFLPEDRINGQVKVLGTGEFGGALIDCKMLLDLSGTRAD